MYYLIVSGIIISNFISKPLLDKELEEAKEVYKDKSVEVRKHTSKEVLEYVRGMNKSYSSTEIVR